MSDTQTPVNVETSTPSKSKLPLWIGGGVAALALVGAGGAFAWNALHGEDSFPTNHISSSAAGYVQFNLDPSGEQKLSLVSLAQKYPELLEDPDFKKAVEGNTLAEIFKQLEVDGNTYEWAGGKVALAIDEDADDDSTPEAVLFIESKDNGKAEAELAALVEKLAAQGQEFEYALYDDGYVSLHTKGSGVNLISDEDTLKDHSGFQKLMNGKSTNITAGWIDLGAAKALAPQGDGLDPADALLGEDYYDSYPAPELNENEYEGQAAFTVKASTDGLSLIFDSLEVKVNGEPAAAFGDDVSAVASDIAYEDALGTIGAAAVGENLANVWHLIDPDGSMAQQYAAYGLSIPEDLPELLGDTALSLKSSADGDDFSVSVVSKEINEEKIRTLLSAQGITIEQLNENLSRGETQGLVTLENGELRFVYGEASSGAAAQTPEGQIVAYVDLDKLPSGAEVPEGLGKISAWSNGDEKGNSHGEITWTTGR